MTSPARTPLHRSIIRQARAVRLGQRHPGMIEIGIFVVALLAYQASRAFVIGDPSQAFRNAAGIIRWEQSIGLFVELNVQQWAMTHLWLTEGLNWFYMYGHWTATPAFFVWLYRRHANLYPYVRDAFLAANAVALVVFMVFPVAPPRMLSAYGFVDTLQGVSNIDLHHGVFSGWFNPHAAVPSMHFGYAFMIGVVLLIVVRSWWAWMAGLAYPSIVFFTIVATGNHFVLDAIAGGMVVATGFVMVQAWRAVEARRDPALALARTR